jgi:hypothetical protein
MEDDTGASWAARLARVWAWLAGPCLPLLAGVGFRLWFYLLNDSFWRDDSKLLLNVAQKSFVELMGRLDYSQEAPVTLLWLWRLLYLGGAGGELPMRAFSLLASVLALGLFYLLAKRVIADSRAVVFSTWLLALAPGAILFAALTKPYSSDLLATVGLTWLAASCFLDTPRRRQVFWLTLAAALAPWVSYPSVFVAGAIGLGLLLRWRSVGFWPVAGFLTAVVFSLGLELVTVLTRSVPQGQAGTLMQGPPMAMKVLGSVWSWGWVKIVFYHVFFAYLGPQEIYFPARQASVALWLHPFLAGLVLLAGLGLWESRRQYGPAWALVVCGPLTLCLAGCMLGWYLPLGRLLLFAFPGICLLAAYGASLLFRWAGRSWPVGAILCLLVLPCVWNSAKAFTQPVGGVREALQYIHRHQQPGDLVYFDLFAAPTIEYYRLLGRAYALELSYGLAPEEFIEGYFEKKLKNVSPHQFIDLMPSEKRVWILTETGDYARGVFPGIHPFWKLTCRILALERTKTGFYATDRVLLQGFSARQP